MTPTDSPTERRHFQRVNFASAAVLSQGGRNQAVDVVDLSLKGILLDNVGRAPFDFNRPTYLTLSLTDNAVITMTLLCVHQTPGTMANTLKCGFRCDGIDLDSIGHLRRLVELNLGDPAALDRELCDLIGSRLQNRTSR